MIIGPSQNLMVSGKFWKPLNFVKDQFMIIGGESFDWLDILVCS